MKVEILGGVLHVTNRYEPRPPDELYGIARTRWIVEHQPTKRIRIRLERKQIKQPNK